jgi:glycosyltransferase involved in cell wall biosynthesis
VTERQLKLLYVSIEYPPESPNGIGSYVVEVAAAMGRLGHDVHVLSCIPGQSLRDYRDGDVWVHRRDEPRLRGLGRLVPGHHTAARIRHSVACWLEARRLGTNWDVVEAPDWMAEGLLLAIARWPVVSQLHTPLAVTRRYSGRPFTRDIRVAAWLERVAVERSRLVVSPSRLLAGLLADSGWTEVARARIVRLPIDLDEWQATTPVQETRPVVLFSGRLEHLKAPDVLVEAAALLKKDVEFEMWLAGRSGGTVADQPYGRWLEGRIRELDVPCRLLGQVSREEIRRLVQQARVVAVPSRYENLPYTGLEAMASGRPVVCTSNTGLSEILDSSAGGVVPPDDPEAMARALRPVLADVTEAARAGARARALVARHCSSTLVAGERECLYRRVADRSSA